MVMFEILWTVLIYPRSLLRSQHELPMEILALRHQITVLKRRAHRPKLRPWGPVALDDTQESLAELESSVDDLPA